MAPISTIFGPNESQRCQLKFEKIGLSKKFPQGRKIRKTFAKSWKKLSRVRFRAKNKIETAIWMHGSTAGATARAAAGAAASAASCTSLCDYRGGAKRAPL